MACKPDDKTIDKTFEITDNQQALENAIALLKEESLLAVKCECQNGAEVTRENDINFIMVATKEKTYIFDVDTMGKTVFTSGLQSILESKSQEKLMFDCREQSDALWHQFQVKISGVLDLQLLEVMYRRENSASIKKHKHRSHRHEKVECVYGFYHSMELYVKDILFEGKNEEEKHDLLRLRNVLYNFPVRSEGYRFILELGSLIKEMFIIKVTSMFTLYKKMKEILSSEEKDRLLIASERYADFYRTRGKRSVGPYEEKTNKDVNISHLPEAAILSWPLFGLKLELFDGFTDGYLPLDIIPEKGMHSCAKAIHTCLLACKPDENFEILDNQQALDNAITLLKEEALLAVKCESQNGATVSRGKDISFIMVATKEKTYIFDVDTMGKTIFTSGLQSILESKSQEKLMFDCREQSDALWHQFQVKISGVLDLQLLEVMYRRENSSSKTHTPKYTRRSDRHEEVECVYGFYHCMELYVKDILFDGKNKEEKKEVMKIRRALYRFPAKKTLPLQDDRMKEMYLIKVTSMFTLYEKMKEILRSEEKERLLMASERYADFYRSRERYVHSESSYVDRYEANTYEDVNISQLSIDPEVKFLDGFTDAYLPLDIIPEKGMHSFAKATHSCTTCRRKFPRQEFSNTQLRNGNQKCRVCKKIKQREDLESQREENDEIKWFRWQRRQDFDDSYDDFVYYGEDSEDEYYF